MGSLQGHSLKALVVFKNYMHPELMRAVHVYRLEEGVEKEVEREYVFHGDSAYEETGSYKVLTLEKFQPSSQFKGRVNGVWLCIFVFDADHHRFPNLNDVPPILSISRNPKLAAIPTLANDLQVIFQLNHRMEDGEKLKIPSKETKVENNAGGLQLRRKQRVFVLDLNSVPYQELIKQSDEASGIVEKKKRRAATKDIARLDLADLAKYFDLPIVEASKNLKVGLTVLKKKCREFGIPRWPHRKIKSLDSLIRDLQAEADQQQREEDKAAAVVVAKRQRMLESEKECIEREPFMEIQKETKKFRQDIFKKRHKARARENQFRTIVAL